MILDRKIAVVMPAYNAAKTLKKSWSGIPHAIVDEIILIDDSSVDDTVGIAQKLGIQHVIRHETNLGYGGIRKVVTKKHCLSKQT